MRDLWRGSIAALCVAALGACVTTRDAVGGGDARLDEAAVKEGETAAKAKRACGPSAPGDVVLLDARTGGPVTCQAVTLMREQMGCTADCASDVVFKGLTNERGQVLLTGPLAKSRLVAVVDGFEPSALQNATSTAGKVLEVELAPAEGFWLKVLDGDGNYLPDVSLSFKQGEQVIAQLRTNVLANVFFTQHAPFAGEPVTVTAEGYQPVTINGVADLGDDGHTLTLRK